MAALHLNEKLMRFALFKGMGHAELAELVARTRLDFSKHAPGGEIVHAGDVVRRLLLLLDGSLTVTTASADMKCTVSEEAEAPFIIEPERLFGLRQLAARTFRAATTSSIVAIDKTEVARLCSESIAFRLNMLNLLATKAQRQAGERWAAPPQDLRQRIARFVESRCVSASGRKTVTILMERLADEVNDSRINVSRALRAMEEAGLVSLGRGRIDIPELGKLLTL